MRKLVFLMLILTSSTPRMYAQAGTESAWGKETVFTSGKYSIGLTMMPRMPSKTEVNRGGTPCDWFSAPATCTLFHYRLRNASDDYISLSGIGCSFMFEPFFLNKGEWEPVPYRQNLDCGPKAERSNLVGPDQIFEGDAVLDSSLNLDPFRGQGSPPLRWRVEFRVGTETIRVESPIFHLDSVPAAPR